jgi:tRNA(Ile)-lysidine synthase
MIKDVRQTIKKYTMLEAGESVVVAVSGGPDSVALLKVLEIFSGEYSLTLIAAHLNHGLREEADVEEQFVRELSNEMGITCECKKVDVMSFKKGTGKCVEDISRDVRYHFLNDIAKKHHAQKIALGHHLNDQIETVLMNFLRGSGPDGLKGILPSRDSLYIRPLLGVSRKKILSFLESRRISFMTDASNMEELYLRNRIRHVLIPELKKHYNPNLEDNLANMAEIMRLENDYLKTVTDAILSEWDVGVAKDENRINILVLGKYHEAVQRRVVKNILQKSTPHSKGIEYAHVKSVLDLTYSNNPSGSLNLPYGIVVRREYDSLVISRGEKSKNKDVNEKYNHLYYKVTIPGTVNVSEIGKTLRFDFVNHTAGIHTNMQSTVYMDYDMITCPVIIRTAKPGDRIKPLGMKGTKKIKSYFIDEKIPLNSRKRIPLLLDQESVLWIAGMRLSERVKITKKTRNILRVEIV